MLSAGEMRVPSVFFLAITWGCALANGQFSPQFEKCWAAATTQFEMRVCANEELIRVNARQDETYRKVLSVAGASPSGGTLAVEKIKAMQACWIAYRDAFQAAMYPAADKQANYGTSYATDYLIVYVNLG